MSGIFNLDAPIWVFLSEVADMIILALLWWGCCLGIVTIGASTTALYYVLGKKIRKEQTYVAKDFFKSFTQNFRQSVPLSIIVSIAFISLALYISFILAGIYSGQEVPYLKFMIPVTIIFAFEVVSFHTYTWSLLSRFDMPNKSLIKTAFVMTHRHLLVTIWNLVMVAIVIYSIVKFPLLIIVAPALIVFAQSYMLQPLFTGYIEGAKSTNEVGIVESEEVDDDMEINMNEEIAVSDKSSEDATQMD